MFDSTPPKNRSFSSRLARRPKIVMVDDSMPFHSPEELKNLKPWEWSTPKGPQLMALLIWQAGGEPVHLRRHVPDEVLAAQGIPAAEIEHIKTHPEFSSPEAKQLYGDIVQQLKNDLLTEAKATLPEADGIILLGNYFDLPPPPGQEPHPKMVHPPLRDCREVIESEMYDYAEAKGLSIFGICGGFHVMAAKNDCNRRQHLADRKHMLAHETGILTSKQHFAQAVEKMEETGTCILPLAENGNPVTTVTLVDQQSILYDIVRRSRGLTRDEAIQQPLTFDIACRHHQGMLHKDVNAANVIATAIAGDGVVEAFELHRDINPCAIAIQGHSEVGIGETICPIMNMFVGMAGLQRDRRAAGQPPASYEEYREFSQVAKSMSR